jgi:peptidoglycan/xylan/chitin deacetylase (PgdA/CDA1 family)
MRAEIGWDVDPSDYARPAAWTIVARVLAAADGGSVLPVMHDGGGDRSNTVAALTPIIQGLKARGYKFVRLCD